MIVAEGGGRAGPQFGRKCLQWGRNMIVAEGRPRCLLDMLGGPFNGAAT